MINIHEKLPYLVPIERTDEFAPLLKKEGFKAIDGSTWWFKKDFFFKTHIVVIKVYLNRLGVKDMTAVQFHIWETDPENLENSKNPKHQTEEEFVKNCSHIVYTIKKATSKYLVGPAGASEVRSLSWGKSFKYVHPICFKDEANLLDFFKKLPSIINAIKKVGNQKGGRRI